MNKRRRCNSRIGSPEQTLVGWPTLSLIGWGCGLRCFPLTRRWLLSYWPRSWSWALIMPQVMCGAEYEWTVATWQTRPKPARDFPRPLSVRTLKDRSLVLCLRQNAPSLQIAGCIAAGGGQRQPIQTQRCVPQFGRVCRPVQIAIPDY